jgi:ATP-dependent DNA helicase RecG
LCAFANSAGGTVLIGVMDNGSIKPLTGLNNVKSQIQNNTRNCEPPVHIDIQTVEDVLVVQVPSSRDKPHASRGHFYLREGANSQQMNRNQIRDFFFKEGLIYFDAIKNHNFSIDRDLQVKQFNKFSKMASIPPELNMIDTLTNIGLCTVDGTYWQRISLAECAIFWRVQGISFGMYVGENP